MMTCHIAPFLRSICSLEVLNCYWLPNNIIPYPRDFVLGHFALNFGACSFLERTRKNEPDYNQGMQAVLVWKPIAPIMMSPSGRQHRQGWQWVG
jgi:hypothetical protein